MDELEKIVQGMLDAGKSKEEIAAVIKEHKTTQGTETPSGQPTISNSYGNIEPISFSNPEEQLKLYKAEINDARKQFRAGDISHDERKKIVENANRKRDNLRASLQNFLTFQETINDAVVGDDINIQGTNGLNAQFYLALQNNGRKMPDGSSARMGFTDNGEMIFQYVDRYGDPIKDQWGREITTRQNNAQNLLTPKARKQRTNISKKIFQETAKGARGAKYNANEMKNLVEEQITTKATFNDLVNYKIADMESTITDMMWGKSGDQHFANLSPKVTAELFASLDVSRWDTGEKDGVINEEDFATEENYRELLSALLDTENPAFNLTSSVGFVSNVISEVGGRYHQRGMDKYNASKNIPKTETIDLPWAKGVRKPTTEKQISDYNLVANISSSKQKIRAGNDFYDLQPNGEYKLVQQMVQGNVVNVGVKSQLKRSKTELIQLYGGDYSGIPNDFNWGQTTELGKGPLMSLQNPEKGSVDYYFNLITE